MNPTLDWLLNQKINNLPFTCLAGENGLNKTISSINIMDNPDTVPWLKENELILSTGYIFISTDIYKSIIQNLHDKGCCGLGIKMHRYMESIPEEMIKQANILDFPIFSIPFSTTMEQIINIVYYEMFRNEMSESERTMIFYRDILMTAMKHHKALPVIQKLSHALSMPVFMTDPDFQILEYYISPDDELAIPVPFYHHSNYLFPEVDCLYLKEQKTGSAPVLEHEISYQEMQYKFTIFPVYQKKTLLGYLALLEINHVLSAAQYDLISNLQSVLAIIFMRNQLTIASESFSHTSFYNELLSGVMQNPQDIEKLCIQYGFDYNSSRICFTVQSQKYRNMTVLRQKPYINRLLDHILSISDKYQLNIRYTLYNHNLVCFLTGKESCKTETSVFVSCIQNIAKKLVKEDSSIKIGYSRPLSHANTIYQSYMESLRSIELGQKLHSDENIFSYENDIIYHILSSNMTTAQLYDYYSMILKVLDDYDMQNNTDLSKTLHAYLKNNQNISQTAKALYIHRNTMIHRMDQIWEILSLDSKNSDHIYLIQTAFYIKELLQL